MLTLISGYPNPNFDLYPGEDMDMIKFLLNMLNVFVVWRSGPGGMTGMSL